MKIAITTDHAGFEKLKELAGYIAELGHECVDFGPAAYDVNDDYPDFIFPAARAVANGECERGIIMGGSGQGEAIAANRFAGVRCALFYGPVLPKLAVNAEGEHSEDPYAIVRLSREHNDANVLSLAARFLDMDEMKTTVKLWLETAQSEAARHARRIQKLESEGSKIFAETQV
jgi:ribose 5-phosphate isomerase B